jgi:hypothetical protein
MLMVMPRPKLDRVSYTATMRPDLLAQVDEATAARGLTRSAFIEAACRAMLDTPARKRRRSLGEFGGAKRERESPTRHENGDMENQGRES